VLRPVPPLQTRDEEVVPVQPARSGESFATEPKAVSRQSEHGRSASDAEIDAWIDEAMARDVDLQTPGSAAGAFGDDPDAAADRLQPGSEPLLDAGTAKAIRSEAAMLRKAAERDPEA
jgi:hypothetical protein